jgi:hypothetical protein
MAEKFANIPGRSSKISEEECAAAKNAIKAFDMFLKELWSARQHDERLLNVLDKAEDVDPAALFEIRHLLRRFQKETKEKYTHLIMMFSGKRDENFNSLTPGIINLLTPLENDTTTRQIKIALQDAMQQLSGFMEEFLEAFEDFTSKDQIKEIKLTAKKAEKIIQSIENIIEKQMQVHFERNILGKKTISSLRNCIKRRARIINLLEAEDVK